MGLVKPIAPNVKVNLDIKPADFEYVILPTRFCSTEYLPAIEKAFRFWSEGWAKVFADNGVDKVPRADDFFRQDFVTMVTCGEEVAAIHFYSLYDFRTDLVGQHSYMRTHFNQDFIKKCQSMNFKKLMSMESLLANPNFRKSKTGLNFAELMGSLGQKIFQTYTDADAIFTPTRVDNKTSQAGQMIGFKPLQRDVMVNNTPIDFLVCGPNDIIPPREPVRFFMDHLWRSRKMDDHLPLPLKRAA